MQLSGRVAIVTGAARGIGQAISEAILQKNGKVCLSDIDDTAGRATSEEFKTKYGETSVTFFQCDVTKKSQQEDLFKFAAETFGRIDILCNNAGILAELYDNYEMVININLTAVISGCIIAVEYFKKHGGGVIINTASRAGLAIVPHVPVYVASKTGVIAFTRSLAAREEDNIRVNAICPGTTRTRIVEKLQKNEDDLLSFLDEYGILEPSQVAQAVIQLIEDESKNGAVLKITGTGGSEFV